MGIQASDSLVKEQGEDTYQSQESAEADERAGDAGDADGS